MRLSAIGGTTLSHRTEALRGSSAWLMDAEIEAYRTVLREQLITAPEIGKRMAETVQDKRRLENLLGVEPTTKLTVEDVKAIVAGLRDITPITRARRSQDQGRRLRRARPQRYSTSCTDRAVGQKERPR